MELAINDYVVTRDLVRVWVNGATCDLPEESVGVVKSFGDTWACVEFNINNTTATFSLSFREIRRADAVIKHQLATL